MKKGIFKISYKITAMIILMVTICSISVGIFVYRTAETNLYRLKGETAQTAAQTLAAALDEEAIHTLVDTEKETPYYENLKQTIGKAIEKIPGLAFLYVITMDNVDVIVVYGQNVDGSFFLPIGYRESLEIWNEAAKRSFKTASLAYSEPYDAEFYGKLVSGYAPIVNAEGDTIAIVGLDLLLEDIIQELREIRIAIIEIVCSFVLLFSVISVLYTKRSIGNPITKLSVLSERIAKGDIRGNIQIKSNDELGLLAENFGKMQTAIGSLHADIRDIVKNAANGVLEYRTQSDKYPGAWGEVSEELNHLLDAITAPIDELAVVLHKIAEGQFDTRITREYKGDYDRIKESVNSTALGINRYFNEKILAENAAAKANFERECAEAVSEAMMSSIRYASTIQQNVLPKNEAFEKVFSDHSVIWKPRDIVGGDIYWLRTFESGTVLCVCDCTGHGVSGALLTTFVTTIFDSYIKEHNCSDTADILWNLDQKLMSVFGRQQDADSYQNKDGCDLAVLFIAKDGTVTISSAHMHVYICDGKAVTRLKGQHLFIGEGSICSREEIKVNQIPANPDNKFYIASDGLSDQPGGSNDRPYGYKGFMKIILENHAEKQSVISDKVWDAFEAWRGERERVDDFEFISFQP